MWYSARQMTDSARDRAKRAGLACDLTVEEVHNLCFYRCPVLGVELVYGGSGTTKRRNRYAASLDRIDNDGGYTVDNVQVISWQANKMKQDASPDELYAFARWVLGADTR